MSALTAKGASGDWLRLRCLLGGIYREVGQVSHVISLCPRSQFTKSIFSFLYVVLENNIEKTVVRDLGTAAVESVSS